MTNKEKFKEVFGYEIKNPIKLCQLTTVGCYCQGLPILPKDPCKNCDRNEKWWNSPYRRNK